MNNFKVGDRTVVMVNPDEDGISVAHWDDHYTVFNITSDPDGDGTNSVVILGSYDEPPSDLLVLEAIERSDVHTYTRWKIIDDE